MLARMSGHYAPAVVADKGPSEGLGEITPHLGWQLNSITPDSATLPLGEIAARLSSASVPSADYFIFVDSSVAYAAMPVPADPRRRRLAPINPVTIDAAFSVIGVKRIEADLDSCAI